MDNIQGYELWDGGSIPSGRTKKDAVKTDEKITCKYIFDNAITRVTKVRNELNVVEFSQCYASRPEV